MTRALVPGLASPFPLGERLPALYHRDEFAQGLTAALDEVLAPVLSSLDNLDAYLDPQLAPEDFLGWLGTWVGLALDDAWPIDRRRAFVAQASRLYRARGTPAGLAAHLELVTGGRVEIEESGGTIWATHPGEPPPGRPGFSMVVKIEVDRPDDLELAQLDALVAAAKPAHVAHRVELSGRAGP